jgi:hypothetical protein
MKETQHPSEATQQATSSSIETKVKKYPDCQGCWAYSCDNYCIHKVVVTSTLNIPITLFFVFITNIIGFDPLL